MYCLGDRRKLIFSPRASRSRSRWRIFSRSMATDFMRLPNVSVAISGMAKVSTVATAATAANNIAMKRASITCDINRSSMSAPSKIEIDHFPHHEDADRHPYPASDYHELTGRMRPQKLDVLRTCDVDERHHRERERADDHGRGLSFHGHGLDFGFHLLAIAQHARKVAERLGEASAGLLLNADDDCKE